MEPVEYETLASQEETFWWYRGLRELVIREARRALIRGNPDGADRRVRRILDAGCGTGGMARKLASLGTVTGIDFSPLALGYARQQGTRSLARGTVEHLPYRGGAFDLVVSLDVLYHRGVVSDLAALREFHRCLRPGGALVLNLPAFESLRSSHDAAIHTARRYRTGTLRPLLEEAGFRVHRLTHWNFFLFPALALVRRRRRGSPAAGDEIEPSDVRSLPSPMNGALRLILFLEGAWLRRWDLPTGLSLLAVATKPPAKD